MTIIKSRFFLIIFFSLLMVATFGSLIQTDTILSYDDKMLLGPLKDIESVYDYINAIQQGKILDLQPIRDLSYLLDYKLFALLDGHYSFHLTNVIILLGIIFILRKIFVFLEITDIYIFLFLLIFAFSPVTSSSTAWISARKHLLSTFFILWATLVHFKSESASLRSRFFVIILYSLSVLSHPINVLWPLWVILWDNRVQIKVRTSHIFLTSFCFIFLSLNFWYYKFIYGSLVSSFSKFSDVTSYNFGTPLLALGRYFFQTIAPFFALPSSHYPGSIENLIGLFSFVIFSLLIVKIHRNKFYLLYVLYFIVPLIIVTFNMTNIFCSDTYLLNSSIGIYLTLALYLQKQKHQKIILTVLSLYTIAIFTANLKYVEIFKNEDALWSYSYEKEATPQSAGIKSSTLIKQGLFHESYKVIERIQNEWPNHPFLTQIISENIFYNPSIVNAIKIKALEEQSLKTPSLYFYLTILYARESAVEKIRITLPNIVFNKDKFNTEFRGNEELIGASLSYICNFYRINECNSTLEILKNDIAKSRWNETLFQEILKNLGNSREFTLDIAI